MLPPINLWMQNLINMKLKSSAILELALHQGAVTPSDIRDLGAAPENLNRLAKQGRLIRVSRGVYIHPETDPTEHHSYVEVAKAVPSAVFCLLTALCIHNIGTQNPSKVWIAIPRNHRPPSALPVLRVVRMNPEQYQSGVEIRNFEGVQVRVTTLEKTLVDCFRLRRLVGHDVPYEALRDAVNRTRLDYDKLHQLSAKLHVRHLVLPALEAIRA